MSENHTVKTLFEVLFSRFDFRLDGGFLVACVTQPWFLLDGTSAGHATVQRASFASAPYSDSL